MNARSLAIPMLVALAGADGDCGGYTEEEAAAFSRCAAPVLGRSATEADARDPRLVRCLPLRSGVLTVGAVQTRAAGHLARACGTGMRCYSSDGIYGSGEASAGGEKAVSVAGMCRNCGTTTQVTVTAKGTGGSFGVGPIVRKPPMDPPPGEAPKAAAERKAFWGLAEELSKQR